MKRALLLMIVAVAVGAFAPTAHAALWVYLDDPGTVTVPIQVVDQGLGDINPAVGVVTWSGGFDSWVINVTTGIGKAVLGPQLDLNSVNTSSAGPGTLVVKTTDTGYSPTQPGQLMISSFGGTTVGTVQLDQIFDPDNLEFANPLDGDEVVLSSPVLGSGAFSDTQIGLAVPGVVYSLTEVVTINHQGPGVTSFDAHSIVPVPGAVLLGILGLSAAGLKLRKFA